MILSAALAAALSSTPLIVRGHRLFVPARINGVTTEAVLDSAAEASFVDDGFAVRIGAGPGKPVTARGSGGEAKAELIEGARIEAAGLTLDGLTIGVTDLDDVGARLFGRPLDAIVGRELFDRARLGIDIAGGRLTVLPREKRPRGKRLTLSSWHGIETLPVSIEGGAPVQAEFDLGNGSDVTVSKAFAEKAGLLAPGRVVAHEHGGGIGGKVHRPVVVLKTLKLAGVTFRDVRATVDAQPNAAAANIGVKLLRRFAIVTDFAQKSVWLQPLGTGR